MRLVTVNMLKGDFTIIIIKALKTITLIKFNNLEFPKINRQRKYL